MKVLSKNNTGILAICLILAFSGCGRYRVDKTTYAKEIKKWHAVRLVHLKAPKGWLNLVGLYWLHPGNNTFGSDSSNDDVFPPGTPALIGTLMLDENQVTLEDTKVALMIDSVPASHALLRVDTTGKPSVMTWGTFAWYIIKRGNRYGIRLRNYKSPLIEKVDSIPYYPIDIRWRVIAHYTPFGIPRRQIVGTVIGTDAVNIVPGELTFRLNGKKLHLYPAVSDGVWSVDFGDQTNGKGTYSGGRSLDMHAPDKHNHVILDFNKAYNPPCSFTPFGTCELPDRSNRLPVSVEAGEKDMYLVHGHE
jgi:uncharacterized protein (DUF1684 family)